MIVHPQRSKSALGEAASQIGSPSRRAVLAALGGAAGAVLTAGAARAQAGGWPNRPITITVPLAPGTAMDVLTRAYAEELSKVLGQPVIVANQPGAALMLAAQTVGRSAPDGYNLLVTSAPVMAVNPTLYKQIGYDAENGFTPISLYAKSPFLFITDPKLGVASVAEFANRAKSAQPPMNYASAGAGTLQFLAMEAIKRHYGIQVEHVPYRSSPQILTDLMGSHLMSSVYEAGAAIPLVREGKLTALASTSLARHPALPDTPTLGEAMGVPGFEAVSWHVLMAPAGTPQSVLQRLHEEMRKITAAESFQKRAGELGLLPVPYQSVPQISAYIRDERTRWGGFIRDLGLEKSQ
jgi:tripartite-type tricarboxylate transporter receptor subunit TctC